MIILSDTPVRPPALSTAFNRKANSLQFESTIPSFRGVDGGSSHLPVMRTNPTGRVGLAVLAGITLLIPAFGMKIGVLE